MSYDLFFRLRPGRPRPTREAYATWFASRPGWAWCEWGASYADERTGATFHANVRDPDQPPDEEDAAGGSEGLRQPGSGSTAGVWLEMGGTAAHVVGLELVGEVRAFVQAFDLLVDDPQVDGNGRGELDEARLLAGWNAYNAFATKVAHGSLGQPLPPALPAEKLEAAWRWNRARVEDDARFAPRVLFVEGGDGVAETMAAWVGGSGDLPVVDSIQTPHKRVPWRVLAGLLGEPRAEPAPHHRVTKKLGAKLDAAIARTDDVLPVPAVIPPGRVRTLEVLAPYRGIDPAARARAFERRSAAQQLEGEGRAEDALAARREAAALSPDDPELALELAFSLHRAGKQREAMAVGERALALEPSESAAVIATVNAWFVGELSRSLASAERLLQITPGHVNGLTSQLLVMTDLARYDEAVAAADALLARNPGDPMIENARAFALAGAGRAEEAEAGYARALEALDAALAGDASQGELHGRRAYALLGLGRPKEALEAAERALERVRDPFLAKQSKGRALLALGKPRKAIEVLAEAARLREYAPLANLHLALAHAKLGEAKKLAAARAKIQHVPHYARQLAAAVP